MPRFIRRSFLSKTMAVSAAMALANRAWPLANSAMAKSEDHLVEIEDLKFAPSRLSVRAGDLITWINRDIAPHTATANDKSWDTGEIRRGQTKSLRVTPDMSRSYFCRYHPGMKAEVEIVIAD